MTSYLNPSPLSIEFNTYLLLLIRYELSADEIYEHLKDNNISLLAVNPYEYNDPTELINLLRDELDKFGKKETLDEIRYACKQIESANYRNNNAFFQNTGISTTSSTKRKQNPNQIPLVLGFSSYKFFEDNAIKNHKIYVILLYINDCLLEETKISSFYAHLEENKKQFQPEVKTRLIASMKQLVFIIKYEKTHKTDIEDRKIFNVKTKYSKKIQEIFETEKIPRIEEKSEEIQKAPEKKNYKQKKAGNQNDYWSTIIKRLLKQTFTKEDIKKYFPNCRGKGYFFKKIFQFKNLPIYLSCMVSYLEEELEKHEDHEKSQFLKDLEIIFDDGISKILEVIGFIFGILEHIACCQKSCSNYYDDINQNLIERKDWKSFLKFANSIYTKEAPKTLDEFFNHFHNGHIIYDFLNENNALTNSQETENIEENVHPFNNNSHIQYNTIDIEKSDHVQNQMIDENDKYELNKSLDLENNDLISRNNDFQMEQEGRTS